MSDNKTRAVAVFLALSILLVCLAAYQQLEISSLSDRNARLSKDLKETSSLLNLTRSELSSSDKDYSDLLQSNHNLTTRLQSIETSVALLSEALQLLDQPVIFFDKNIYYQDQEVFWNRNNSAVPAIITILDRNADPALIEAKISSSSDFREVLPHRVASGIFAATIYVTDLKSNQTIHEDSLLHAKYGDHIVASYKGTVNASALFVFPKPIGEDGDYSCWKTWTFDPRGVPLVNYGGSIGLQYNPVFVGDYALANYQQYLNTGNVSYRAKFFSMADWFVETARSKGNLSVWEYDFPWPWNVYNATVPYVSALAQGVGIAVLVRAYFLSGNLTYLEVGNLAMNSFAIEMREGGVRYTDSDGVWYEEIADQGAVSGKVLNGFLSALTDIYEYYFGLNDPFAQRLFLEGANSLSRNMYRYDTGSWSYYDLLNRSPASLDYHKRHIEQLTIMYKITNDQTFFEYSDKFQSYLDPRQ